MMGKYYKESLEELFAMPNKAVDFVVLIVRNSHKILRQKKYELQMFVKMQTCSKIILT